MEHLAFSEDVNNNPADAETAGLIADATEETASFAEHNSNADRGNEQVHDAALEQIAMGRCVIPVAYRSKKVSEKSWTELRISAESVPKYFSDSRQNIGVLLGEPSGWLVDVDLDCPETVSLASEFLPPTGLRFGRRSKRLSHWFYHAKGLKSVPFKDGNRDTGGMLVEIRSSGAQTVIPPSVHVSGEPIEWAEKGPPAEVEPDDLITAVGRLAAAALLVRTYPAKGTRHQHALALAGALLRGGWSVEEVKGFISIVTTAGGAEDVRTKLHAVDDTYDKMEAGDKVTGLSALGEIIGQERVKLVAKWLRLKGDSDIYRVENGNMVYLRAIQGAVVSVRLSNFNARIVEDVTVDDGADVQHEFHVESQFGHARVPAAKFTSLRWIAEQWGAKAIIQAGDAVRAHLPVAIQTLSGEIPERTVYAHTGWRAVDGRLLYLHAGGAIGPAGLVSGIEVAPGGSLAACRLPPPQNPREAVAASLRLLTAGPPAIMYPLLAAVYRAPLAHFLPIGMSVFLAGDSGTFKSAISGVVQSHFGADWWDAKRLPANWSSTSNALERLAFIGKDMLLTIDDFCPKGTNSDIARLHQVAERVLRSQGNLGGRQRLNSESAFRKEMHPRGMILSSGEDIPAGKSLRARALLVEVQKGDIDKDALTALQRLGREGVLAQAMFAYVQRLAGKAERLSDELAARHDALRDQITGTHARTPDNIASLMVGLEQFMELAVAVEAVTESEADQHKQAAFAALCEQAHEQDAHQRSEDPVERFVEYLCAAVTGGYAHIASTDDSSPPCNHRALGWDGSQLLEGMDYRPKGTRIGWIKDDNLYLLPDLAYGEAQRVALAQGRSLSLTPTTLWKRLSERGYLRSAQSGRNTAQVTVAGRRVRVIHMSSDTVLGIVCTPVEE